MPYLSLCVILIICLCLPASCDVQAWFAPSATKVMRSEKPSRAVSRELAAARNEVEACQVVLLSDREAKEVRVAVSELRHTRGKGVLRPALNGVAYIPSVDKKTAYPDPLPPYAPIDLKPNEAQPVWVSVRVPKDAEPGTYRGVVKVEAGSQVREMSISVRVWDFALPDTPSCQTAFGLNPGYFLPQHGVEPGTAKAKGLHMKYYEMLLDHKISPYHIPVDLMSDAAVKYLDDPRLTSYMIPYPEKDDDLRKIVQRLIDGGWFEKGYFYPIDEPNSAAAYEQFTKIVERLRRIEPNYRIVTPFFCNPDYDIKLKSYDLMLGKVNIWCPESCLWDNVNIWAPQKGLDDTLGPLMEARRNAGDTVWWYVCCGPGSPYSSFFLDMTAMQHRMLFWQQKMKGVQGLLYWETTYWNAAHGCPDPWETMTTLTHVNPNLMGDGSLLYPGKKVGVDGPISSQRLEVIRDGIEDFEYLTLADQRIGKDASRPYVARLVKSLTEYEADPTKLEAVRRELGAEIEKATVAARKGM